MAVEVIDLCSSPEPEESPSKLAQGALAGFLPRKDKVSSKPQAANGSLNPSKANGYQNGQRDERTAFPSQTMDDHYEPNENPHNDDTISLKTEFEEQQRLLESASVGKQWHMSNGHSELSDELSEDDGAYDGPDSGLRWGPEGTKATGSNGHQLGTEPGDLLLDFEIDNSTAAESHESAQRAQRDHSQSSYSLRPFRIDKSKRYGGASSKPHTNCNGFEEQVSTTSPTSIDSKRRPKSSERLLESLLPGHEPSGPTTDYAQEDYRVSPRPATVSASKAAILSGAGLEIRQTVENTNLRPFDSPKRPASSFADDGMLHEVKRPRMEGQTPSKRSEIILVDVTSPDTERVSYSDEPEFTTPDPNPPSPMKATAQHLHQTQGKQTMRANFSKGPNRKGEPYSEEEDTLICQLKQDGLNWDEIARYFNGRAPGSIQVRWYTKLRANGTAARPARAERKKSNAPSVQRTDSADNLATGRGKRSRNTAPSALDGFVSWASLKGSKRNVSLDIEDDVQVVSPEPALPQPLLVQDCGFPSTLSQILRRRELGQSSRRSWAASSPRAVYEEARNHVHGHYNLQKQYHGASGDIVAMSWAPDGDRFAAGAIAISDQRSMQYNMQRNLLVGSRQQGTMRELLEHHVPRPLVEESDNVNTLHAMRATQDPRLFKTVTQTAFSHSSSKKLYTTGEDKMLRRYSVGRDLKTVKCRYEIPHPARVDLLAVSSPNGIVATGCHAETDSIRVFRCHERDYETGSVYSPTRGDSQSSTAIYPSTLKWGIAYQHRTYLLAGFGGDEDKENAGETCLWNVDAGTSIHLRASTMNVFDVAWNPNPSSASVTFAVASSSSSLQVGRGTRSAIQCFAPEQDYARKVLIWECPAADINDVVFCPYDDNLIAAGATNGTVYIWDRRFAAKSQKPLHTLHHGATENIIAHDRDPETADTGVRFLSWGATKTRLYSGSHDGIVKVWNPYRSQENAHVDDIAPPQREKSAVMSGAFNPDYRELLIGTENGRINLYSIEGGAVYKPQQFKLETAPPPKEHSQDDPLDAARSLLDAGKIEIRPCGAMPFRQAVQGPNYDGPYLAPTPEQIRRAEDDYDQALVVQSDAHLRKAQDAMIVDDDDDTDIVKADGKVLSTQQMLNDLQDRLGHFSIAQPKAEEFQRSLVRAEDARAALLSRSGETVEPCQMPCAVLPVSDEVEDSGRSELRIPGALRSIEQNAARTHVGDESASTCASCFPLQARGKKHFCASCTLKRAGLTATCSQCSAPARVQIDPSRKTLCERCSFACVRCSGPAAIDDAMTFVSCGSCQLTWELGVLGYNLVSAPERQRLNVEEEATEQYDDFGSLEREHYASLWQDKDANDMMGF